MATGRRIIIDPERCIGSGSCGFWAPATFDIGDDGVAIVIDPDGDSGDKVANAAESCPTRAIAIEEGPVTE